MTTLIPPARSSNLSCRSSNTTLARSRRAVTPHHTDMQRSGKAIPDASTPLLRERVVGDSLIAA